MLHLEDLEPNQYWVIKKSMRKKLGVNLIKIRRISRSALYPILDKSNGLYEIEDLDKQINKTDNPEYFL